MSHTDFDIRMKHYEKMNEKKLFGNLPVLARLDGKCFHSFCNDLEKPYDINFIRLIRLVTRELVEETNAKVGYCESDEISLCYYSDNLNSQIFFDGKHSKMVSILAAMASVKFNKYLPEYLPNKVNCYPVFDCRVWNVPTLEEAANCFVWRQHDSLRNSKSMSARAYYSHKECFEKSSSELQEMLFQKGINWNDYPPEFKRGSFFIRNKQYIPFSAIELEKLPEKHDARANPNMLVERTVIMDTFPDLLRINNRVGFLFNNERAIHDE